MNSQHTYNLAFNPKKHIRHQKQPRTIPLKTYQPSFAFQQQTRFIQREEHEYRQPFENNPQRNMTPQMQQRLQRIQMNENEIKKQEMWQRVKILQDKVLPFIERQEDEGEEAWQCKIQLKLTRIQNGIDNMRREWEAKIQSKLLELERQWESRWLQITNSQSF